MLIAQCQPGAVGTPGTPALDPAGHPILDASDGTPVVIEACRITTACWPGAPEPQIPPEARWRVLVTDRRVLFYRPVVGAIECGQIALELIGQLTPGRSADGRRVILTGRTSDDRNWSVHLMSDREHDRLIAAVRSAISRYWMNPDSGATPQAATTLAADLSAPAALGGQAVSIVGRGIPVAPYPVGLYPTESAPMGAAAMGVAALSGAGPQVFGAPPPPPAPAGSPRVWLVPLIIVAVVVLAAAGIGIPILLGQHHSSASAAASSAPASVAWSESTDTIPDGSTDSVPDDQGRDASTEPLDSSSTDADSDDSTDAATSGTGDGAGVDTSGALTATIDSTTVSGKSLIAEVTVACPTAGGDVALASPIFNVDIMNGSRTVASASFDLSRTPLRLSGGDGGSATLTFIQGTNWPKPGDVTSPPNSALTVRVDDASTDRSADDSSATPAVNLTLQPQLGDGSTNQTSLASLNQQADSDRSQVLADDSDQWVPQLESKNIGTQWDGTIYDATAIWRQYKRFSTAYPDVLVVRSAEWHNFAYPDYWVLIVDKTFPSAAAANAWCDQQGIPIPNCFATRMATTGGTKGNTVFRNP